MIIFQQRVFPQDIQSNPCVYYIIADNDARAGHTVYRNCENVIGVELKRMNTIRMVLSGLILRLKIT